MTDQLDLQIVLDGLGQGVLIFDSEDRLVMQNLAARSILGSDLNVIRAEGWRVAAELFNTGLASMEQDVNRLRADALVSVRPLRFHILRSGSYIPCWMAAVVGQDGRLYTMVTLDAPDWELVSNVMKTFRAEASDAIESTLGHIRLINRTLAQTLERDAKRAQDQDKDRDEADDLPDTKLVKRLSGFTTLISVHMTRAQRLVTMIERLEDIRTGRVHAIARQENQRIDLEEYLEDQMEELEEVNLLDPETEKHDYRARIQLDIQTEHAVSATPRYLTYVLRDVLRNAIMYSLRGTPIKIHAATRNEQVQLDIIDEGYGIREKEWERVFEPFKRGRQPQIISEFGYGLSLHLCKHEVEAMRGRLWFKSEENVGTTISLTLPLWRDAKKSEPVNP